MYYPRFTKAIIHHFMSKDPSIPKKNKFGALLPIELTNDEIRNSKAYKEDYAIATGEAAPKPKASDDGEDGDHDDADQEVVRDEDKDDDEEGGDDEHESDEETREEESFDPIPQTPEDSDDEGDGEEDLGLIIGEEERHDEEEEEGELYRDVNINQGRGLQGTLEVEDTHVTLTPVKPDGQQESSSTPTSVAPLPITTPTMTSSTIATTTTRSQAPNLPTIIPSDIIQNLPSSGSLLRFDDRLRTSYVVAADLSKMELKKILIEKIEGNKSIQCSDEQRNLYKALVDAYESDKIILDTYGETVTLKRRRDDDEDKDEEPSVGPDRGSKRRREGKEPESASAPSKTATKSAGRSTTGSRSRQASESESAFAKEPVQTTSQMEEPLHLEFETGAENQPIIQSSQHPEWFSQPQKPPTLDCDWNKTLPAVYGSIQPWISELAKQADSRSPFNELMDTPLDFSNFIMNRLRVDIVTPELIARPTYDLMKGSVIQFLYLFLKLNLLIKKFVFISFEIRL
nr:hypothetical protein [Tanacetum cinerariifolium]